MEGQRAQEGRGTRAARGWNYQTPGIQATLERWAAAVFRIPDGTRGDRSAEPSAGG